MKKLLDALQMSYAQFRDFCIMCGTDYNHNIPKIGPDRAYRLIREYETIENLENHVCTDILKYKDVRRLFANDIKFDIQTVYCGRPRMRELEMFCFKNNCNFDRKRLRDAFCMFSARLVFLDAEDSTENTESTKTINISLSDTYDQTK
jgi:5'-3' exonuclease